MCYQNILRSPEGAGGGTVSSMCQGPQSLQPSAPPMYPIIIPDKFRLDMISDCKKELENNITHYWRVLAKLKKIRSACHTTYIVTGVTATVLSTSGMAVSLSGIGIIAGAPIYVNSI